MDLQGTDIEDLQVILGVVPSDPDGEEKGTLE
jgi:hypothetical protein